MVELGTRAREELQAPWDDVREARVLSRILADAEPKSRGWGWARIGLSLAALATALALVVMSMGRDGHDKAKVVASVPTPSAPAPGSSILALADGSKAHLRSGAVIEPLEQTRQVVRISQQRGEVRYEVKPDAARPFSVQARDVEVRVLGTVFTVNVEADGVAVSVERGRVSVLNGARRVELAAGEQVRLSSTNPAGPAPAAVLDGNVTDAAVAQPESSAVKPAPSAAAAPSAAELLSAADQARASGDLIEAERLLTSLITQHPRAPQAASASFSLGRVQSARGNFAAASRTFQALRRRLPSGPLAEDALAEAANAAALSGQGPSARSLAQQYLNEYPQGTHQERMRRLGKP